MYILGIGNINYVLVRGSSEGDTGENKKVLGGTPSFPLEPVEDPRYSGTPVSET